MPSFSTRAVAANREFLLRRFHAMLKEAADWIEDRAGNPGSGGAAGMDAFTSRNHSTGAYTHNPALWCGELAQSLTGLVVAYKMASADGWRAQYGGVAVSDIHVVFTGHAGPVAQGDWPVNPTTPYPTVLRFVDVDGNVVDRTLVGAVNAGPTSPPGPAHPCQAQHVPPLDTYELSLLDVQVGVLSEPLPASISPMKLTPRYPVDHWPAAYQGDAEWGYGRCIVRSQEWWSPPSAPFQPEPASDFPVEHEAMFYTSTISALGVSGLENFIYDIYNGDSGTAVMLPVDGEACLFQLVSSGWDPVTPAAVYNCLMQEATDYAIGKGRLDPETAVRTVVVKDHAPELNELFTTGDTEVGFEGVAEIRRCMDEGIPLPPGVYHLDETLTLEEGETLDIGPGAEIRVEFDGPGIEIAGSDVTITGGGSISGGMPVTGWEDTGSGYWRAPTPSYQDGRIRSLYRNGRRCDVSVWPVPVEDKVCAFLPRYGSNFFYSEDGALDSVVGGTKPWTIATWHRMNYPSTSYKSFGIGHYYADTNLQIYRNASGDPHGARLYAQEPGGTNRTPIINQGATNPRQWELVILWFDPVAEELWLQTNDKAPKLYEYPVGQIRLGTGLPVVIGSGVENDGTVTPGALAGCLGPAAVWNRVLTEDERAEFFNEREWFGYDDLSAGIKSGMHSFWGFDDPTDFGKDYVGNIPLTANNMVLPSEHCLGGRRIGFWTASSEHKSISIVQAAAADRTLPPAENDIAARALPSGWIGHWNRSITINNGENKVSNMPADGAWGTESWRLENLVSSLQEGQFAHKDTDGWIYYKPRAGERLETSVFITPRAAVLVARDGDIEDSLEAVGAEPAQLSDVTIDGVTFAHCRGEATPPSQVTGGTGQGWPKENIMDPVAVNLFGRMDDTLVTNCWFVNMGGRLALDIGNHHCASPTATNNVFEDVAGIAIMVAGRPRKSGLGRVTDAEISYNRVHRSNNWYFAGSPIIAEASRDTMIFNNRLSHGSYTGISSHQVWAGPEGDSVLVGDVSGCQVSNNHLSEFMLWHRDGGALYTIASGGRQSGYTAGFYNNLVENTDCDQLIYSFNMCGIYMDAGSTGWDIEDNIVTGGTGWSLYIAANFDATDPPGFRVYDNDVNGTLWNTSAPTSQRFGTFQFSSVEGYYKTFNETEVSEWLNSGTADDGCGGNTTHPWTNGGIPSSLQTLVDTWKSTNTAGADETTLPRIGLGLLLECDPR